MFQVADEDVRAPEFPFYFISQMIRDLNKFNNQEFDLLVIGGGINGVGIAWDAALRGLNVALIEKGDFSAGNSAACFNIIHGGLRYLQHLDFPRLLKSASEQRILREIAGDFIKPLGFILPTSGSGKKGKAFLKIGTTVYELLTLQRNLGFPEEEKIPLSRIISKMDLEKIAPGLKMEDIDGGVIFHDCQINSSERLVIEIAKAAAGTGAVLANYLEFVRKEKGKIVLRDLLTDRQIELKAKYIINATGPWISDVNKKLGVKKRNKFSNLRFIKGIQLIFPKIIQDYSLGIESKQKDFSSKIARGARSYFLQPWHNYTLAGTFEKTFRGDVSNFRIEEEEIDQFLLELQSAYQDPQLSKENLKGSFGGLIPLETYTTEKNYKVARDDLIEEVAEDVLAVMGVKYTTFRALAEKVVDRVFKKLGKVRKPSLTKTTLIKSDRDFNANLFDFPSENLVKRYVKEEMAIKAEDILYRRNMLGVVGEAGAGDLATIEMLIEKFK